MPKTKLIRITTVPIFMNIVYRNQLRYLNQYYEVIGVTSYDEKHYNECKEREGIKMYVVEMARTISPLKDLISLWKLILLIKREKPAIVHTHTPKAGLLGMLASWMNRVPIRLHTIEGLPLVEASGAKRLLLNLIEKVTSACAHKVFPNSHGQKDFIIENRLCPPDKLKVIAHGSSNGIDLTYFTPIFVKSPQESRVAKRKELGIIDNEVVFCFVGRLGIEKGIRELLQAFLKLHKLKKGREIKLLLVGPLEQQNGVLDDETVKVIENTADILYVGRHDDIRPFLLISDVFVFPSYREGFPNVVMQAGAMGLPCLVSDINGCNEIVQQSINGLIFPKKNAEAVFESMKHVLENENERIIMASKAREMIASRYQQDLIWQAWLKEYNDLVNSYV